MINEQSLKTRLHSIAVAKGIPFNACWKRFLLERFLARLAGSMYSNKFIFKGGFLLSYLIKIGRETTDLDFLLTGMNAKELQATFEQICSVYSSDAFSFSFDSITELSHSHMDYPGYRISVHAAFGKMRDKIQVDIGVGDFVDPINREIPLVHYRGEPLYESAISLLVYPIEAIFSEKLETAVSRGPNNTRMKDYHDLFLLLSNEKMLNLDELHKVASRTFLQRKTRLQLIEFDEISLASMQKLWTLHLKGLGDKAQDLDLPLDISEIISAINKYLARINKT